MYALNITKSIKKMSANETRDFILETYCKRNDFSKENRYCAMKRLKTLEQINKNIPHLRNAKKQSIIYEKEKYKISKQSKIIT